MKREMVMLLAMALLMSIVTLPASAANPVQIYIDAPAQAESGDTIGVSLYVNNGANTVGGVEGTVTFDTDMLTYVGVELREDVQLIGNVEEVTDGGREKKNRPLPSRNRLPRSLRSLAMP